MPNIKDQSTVNAIAREFTSNGRNAYKAMIVLGYSVNYADRRSAMVLGSVGVKAAIAEIDAKIAKKQGRTVESLDTMYQEAFDLGKKSRQPAAMNGSVLGLARLYGMDKDAGVGEKTVIIISPKVERKSVVNKEIEDGTKST